MADAIDVGAERPDALAPHPIPVLHVRMRDRSVCILKPRNECRYLKGEPNYADWEMSGDIKEQSPGRRKALTAVVLRQLPASASIAS